MFPAKKAEATFKRGIHQKKTFPLFNGMERGGSCLSFLY